MLLKIFGRADAVSMLTKVFPISLPYFPILCKLDNLTLRNHNFPIVCIRPCWATDFADISINALLNGFLILNEVLEENMVARYTFSFRVEVLLFDLP